MPRMPRHPLVRAGSKNQRHDASRRGPALQLTEGIVFLFLRTRTAKFYTCVPCQCKDACLSHVGALGLEFHLENSTTPCRGEVCFGGMRSSASRDIPSSASIRPALTPTESVTDPRLPESPSSRAPPHLNQALTHLASLIPYLHPDLDNPVFLPPSSASSPSPASWSLVDDAVCKSILALTASAMADFQPPWDVTARTEPHHAQDTSLSQVSYFFFCCFAFLRLAPNAS